MWDRLLRARAKAHPGAPAIIRAEVLVEGVDAITWLMAQSPNPRGYWSDREARFELAGLGRADMVAGDFLRDLEPCLETVHDRLSRSRGDLRYFGGVRFDDRHRDPEWSAFKGCRFILPRFEIVRREDVTTFACNVRSDEDVDDVPDQLQELVFPDGSLDSRLPAWQKRTDQPDAAAWHVIVRKTLDAIARDEFEKVVLARKATFDFEEPVNAAHLLAALKTHDDQAFHFCFQPDSAHAFVGASPERLYRRDGRRLRTEAIAGTRPRGASPEEDKQLMHELQETDKEQREHRIVVKGIADALAPLVDDLAWDSAASVLTLHHVHHLATTFRGVLRDDVHDGQVLASLHPTPAVGGFPAAAALEALSAAEPFDRGYFAAPVGWVERDAAQFAVGIRSGLVARDRLHLFSGAGIVAGSSPEKEWHEVEAKLGAFLDVLRQG